jgi:AraC-like DNA-binding protein
MSHYRLKPDLIDSPEIIYVPFTGGLEQSLDYPTVRSVNPMMMLDCTQAVVGIAIKESRSSFLGVVRHSVEEVLAKLLNRSLKRPLSFESEIDLTSDFGVSLKEFLQFMGRAKDPQPMVSSPLVQKELELALLSCLLKGVANNYSDEIVYQTRGALACYVEKARSFIAMNLHEDIRLGDIATAVGVCPRLLQKAFSQHCGCSPMQFLTQTRLHRIRQDLEQATISVKITDVMLRYGFLQGGKFAKEYRQLFGEKPSETLKRSKYRRQGNSALWQEMDDLQSAQLKGGQTYLTMSNRFSRLFSSLVGNETADFVADNTN